LPQGILNSLDRDVTTQGHDIRLIDGADLTLAAHGEKFRSIERNLTAHSVLFWSGRNNCLDPS